MVSARGYLFLSLNAIRVISIVSLILVFASNIMVMVFDIQAVNRFAANPIPNGNMSTPQSFDYIPGSTVPNQSAGVFWAVMNRLLILFECLFLALAEFDWPIQFFDAYFPVLGSGFGVGSMGIFQCLIGAAVLSHHIGRFALVSAFLLFSIGCVNCLAGLIFRESIKEKRSLSFWNKSKTTPLPMHSTPPSMALPGHYPSGSFSSSQMAFDEKAGSNPWNGPAALAYGKNMMLQSKLQSHPGDIVPPAMAHLNSQPRVTVGADPAQSLRVPTTNPGSHPENDSPGSQQSRSAHVEDEDDEIDYEDDDRTAIPP